MFVLVIFFDYFCILPAWYRGRLHTSLIAILLKKNLASINKLTKLEAWNWLYYTALICFLTYMSVGVSYIVGAVTNKAAQVIELVPLIFYLQWWFDSWLLWSTCQSVLEQYAQPQMAPDVHGEKNIHHFWQKKSYFYCFLKNKLLSLWNVRNSIN